MNFKKLMYLLILSLLINMNNNGISANLASNIIQYESDNISVNSEYMELLPRVQKQIKPAELSPMEYDNGIKVKDIILDINGLDVHNIKMKHNDNLYTTFTTMVQGLLLIPFALYGSIASNIVTNNNKNISDSNTEMIRIRNQSQELIGNAFHDTIKSFIECTKILGSKAITISTTAFGGVKRYIIRKIWG